MATARTSGGAARRRMPAGAREHGTSALRRLRLALDSSADMFLVIDRESMRYVDVNETACRVLGYTREELLSMHPREILPVEAGELERVYDSLIANPAQPSGMNSRYLRKDGSWMPFESTRRVLRDGDRWLIVAVSRDIGARLAAEYELQEQQAGLRRAQAMARLAHVVSGADGHFESWSETLPRLAGCDADSAPRDLREWLLGVHPDDRERVRSAAIDSAASGARQEIEYRLARSDGRTIDIRQVTEPIARTGNAEAATRWFSTLQDVTEQKTAERQLRQFRLAMDTSIDSIYLTDVASMRFIYVNDAACRRLGRTRDELLRLGPLDVLKTGADQLQREYQTVIAAGNEGMRSETKFARADGSEGWTEVHRRAMSTGAGWLVVTIGRDISERQRANERIRGLNRVHAVLSGINSAIVRVRDRATLFREACRIAVEAGGFRFAWLGIVDRNAARVVPMATAGPEDGFMSLMQSRLSLRADAPDGEGPGARAVRERRAVVINDVARDPRVRYKEDHARRGIRSLAMLPITVREAVAGVLALHAGQAGFFDAEEMKLLLELASDIGFALEHIETSERADYLAFYDELTGLANRKQFLERLENFLHMAGHAHTKLAVALFDVERLRQVNESLGRAHGDAVLREVGRRMTASAAQTEIGRPGTDQFAVVIQEIPGRSAALRRIETMRRACFGAPFAVAGHELRMAAKAGIAMFPQDGANAETMLRSAEIALRDAKVAGDRFRFHDPSRAAGGVEALGLETKLRQALEREEFVLHYQPKVELETRAIVGVEALIRWQSPDLGLVPPAAFVGLMEETGLILEAGAWALAQAARDHRGWVEQGLRAPRIAVNVSAIQLRQGDFVRAVEQAILDGVAPTGIDLEITETLIMEDVEANIDKLRAVRDLGLRIAIDDFGTGYSSLAHLAKLPVQALKIDRSFITAMLAAPDVMAVVQTVLSLAHALRLTVIAVGVDSEAQAKVLRLLRCEQMQGFLVGGPIPLSAMTETLRAAQVGTGTAAARATRPS